jgi:hypothetical protein
MGILLQAGNAAFAVRTAESISFADDIGTVERAVPSMGEVTSSVLVEEALVNWPLI